MIILYGYGSIWFSMMKYVFVFYDCGCDVIVYDYCVYGVSEGIYGIGGVLEVEDLYSIM